MKSKVHPTYKTKYRVANWAAYNQALVRRGRMLAAICRICFVEWVRAFRAHGVRVAMGRCVI